MVFVIIFNELKICFVIVEKLNILEFVVWLFVIFYLVFKGIKLIFLKSKINIRDCGVKSLNYLFFIVFLMEKLRRDWER